MTTVTKPDQTQRNSYQGLLSSIEIYFGENVNLDF